MVVFPLASVSPFEPSGYTEEQLEKTGCVSKLKVNEPTCEAADIRVCPSVPYFLKEASWLTLVVVRM
ncbi:MAG: hypothetical protein R2779_05755 [Crocinitomicaceae bacterium]